VGNKPKKVNLVEDITNPGNIVRNVAREAFTAVGTVAEQITGKSNAEQASDFTKGSNDITKVANEGDRLVNRGGVNLDPNKELKDKMDKEAEQARTQEQARIKAEEEQKLKSKKSSQYGIARAKQKSIMGSGRMGTILTSPLGTAAAAPDKGGKTLLGQ
jgi:hypothetical protein